MPFQVSVVTVAFTSLDLKSGEKAVPITGIARPRNCEVEGNVADAHLFVLRGDLIALETDLVDSLWRM